MHGNMESICSLEQNVKPKYQKKKNGRKPTKSYIALPQGIEPGTNYKVSRAAPLTAANIKAPIHA